MTQGRNFNCDNSKSPIATTFNNSNCEKTQKIKLWQLKNSIIVSIVTVAVVTVVKVTYLSKNNMTPWQPMRCSRCSFSRFSQCFLEFPLSHSQLHFFKIQVSLILGPFFHTIFLAVAPILSRSALPFGLLYLQFCPLQKCWQ